MLDYAAPKFIFITNDKILTHCPKQTFQIAEVCVCPGQHA